MRKLSTAGQKAVDGIAQRHGFSAQAVAAMLDAVMSGNGRTAQFNHPEFGGQGQWMHGGMTMISDMFNNTLKARVDRLCGELAELIAREPDLVSHGSFQSQRQGGQHQHGGPADHERGTSPAKAGSLFDESDRGGGKWWPADLGTPNSTGAQNDRRYAYFAEARRLAIELNGKVTVYDTGDHRIGGFSQQQSHGGSLSFTSQSGPVDVASLPVVSGDAATSTASPAPSSGSEHDIFATIEKLSGLRAKGILTDAEFDAKKAELLSRL
jgi:hypothetical protein